MHHIFNRAGFYKHTYWEISSCHNLDLLDGSDPTGVGHNLCQNPEPSIGMNSGLRLTRNWASNDPHFLAVSSEGTLCGLAPQDRLISEHYLKQGGATLDFLLHLCTLFSEQM
ncbi:hypothetical protein CHARACLAT_027292 [Characodon lateralis]|uniref:Uncharacterized protein n=1 Tax=Characodon lateralis TaxID=208331 RepID=A0ABU7CRN0_9TELE|nr:hypothetical protein [Characodon lateralis]